MTDQPPRLRLYPPMAIGLHEDDHERYGPGPWVYDEAAIGRLPLGELVAIEAAIGMSYTQLLLRFRADYADAKRAAVWIARRQAGVVEALEDFEPLVTLMTVERPPGDVDPPEGSGSSPSADPPPESSTSGSPGSPSKPASRRATSRR